MLLVSSVGNDCFCL